MDNNQQGRFRKDMGPTHVLHSGATPGRRLISSLGLRKVDPPWPWPPA